MAKNKKKLFSLCLLFSVSSASFSQAIIGKDCLEYVKKLEEKIYSRKYTPKEKTAFLHYTSRVTDWDNVTVTSQVKIYRKDQKVNFISEKANFFQDEKDMLLALHDQKLVIWNKTPVEVQSTGYPDEFLELREAFFEKCEVVSCDKQGNDENIRVLALKAPEDKSGVLFIDKIIYRYDVKEEKVLQTLIEYKDGYKIKKMEINYHEINLEYAYNFNIPAWKQVLDKNFHPANRYKGYELIDNRKN